MKEARFIPLSEFYFSDIHSGAVTLNQYDFKVVVIFIAVGIFILLMAVSNYVSMSVAQAGYRAKEMATRRLLGSSRAGIFWRMIAESLLLTVVAFVIGFLLAKAAEPAAMELLDVRLNLAGDLSGTVFLAYLLFIGALALLSGFVPATILSNCNPMDVVKGTFRRKTKTVYLRVLNLIQCGLTMAMLTCALYLAVQVYRIFHAPLGYEYGNVIIYYPAAESSAVRLFRDEVKKLPFVERVSFSRGIPIDGGNNNTTFIPSADSVKEMGFQSFVVDSAFMDIYHIRVTEDRHASFSWTTYFVSESAMKELEKLGVKDYFTDNVGREVQIAGKFNDFHIRRSLMENDLNPLRILVAPSDSISPWTISVEVQDGDLPVYKKEIDRLYSDLVENSPFESSWYGDQLKDLYRDIIRMNSLMMIFTFVALVISLLGLTAMSVYFIAQRKRDMAIRKVFGSSSSGERRRLMRFSFVSVCGSLFMAVPLICIGVSRIDRIVTYESVLPLWVPVAAFLAVTIVSLGSVWLISLKASRENPVESLKTE